MFATYLTHAEPIFKKQTCRLRTSMNFTWLEARDRIGTVWNIVSAWYALCVLKKGPKAVIQFSISTEVHYSEGTVMAVSKA